MPMKSAQLLTREFPAAVPLTVRSQIVRSESFHAPTTAYAGLEGLSRSTPLAPTEGGARNVEPFPLPRSVREVVSLIVSCSGNVPGPRQMATGEDGVDRGPNASIARWTTLCWATSWLMVTVHATVKGLTDEARVAGAPDVGPRTTMSPERTNSDARPTITNTCNDAMRFDGVNIEDTLPPVGAVSLSGNYSSLRWAGDIDRSSRSRGRHGTRRGPGGDAAVAPSVAPVEADGPERELRDRRRTAFVPVPSDPRLQLPDRLEGDPGDAGDLGGVAELLEPPQHLVDRRVRDPELPLVGLTLPEARGRRSVPDGRGQA